MKKPLNEVLTGDPDVDLLITALYEASEREESHSGTPSLRSKTPWATDILGGQS